MTPTTPSQTFWGAVTDNLLTGNLQLHWNNGGANPAKDVDILLAYTESPVPEPTVLSLLVLGLVMLLRRRLSA